MIAALCLFSPPVAAAKVDDRSARFSVFKDIKASKTNRGSGPKRPAEKSTEKSTERSGEDYGDLIQKAQNLTLQQDRLQASQILIRGIQRETRNSAAYKELVHALGDLTSVFYTEKAQALFATAESLADSKPREAIENYAETLKLEDRNVLILKTMARAHLRLDECEKADLRVRSAEEVDPYSSEIKLLRLQVFGCQKNMEQLSSKLAPAELETIEKFSRGLQMRDLIERKDTKRARSLLMNWETQSPDYPEVYYWKWQLSKGAGAVDRSSAAKYSQLCQNLTPRKRKAFNLDVELCKNKEVVDLFLREKESVPGGASADISGESH